MATFKICVFRHQKRKDEKYPVSIRITWKRKYAYLKTEYYVTIEQINKRTFELKDPYLLRELNSRIVNFERIKVIKLGSKIELYTAKELVKYFEMESRAGTDSTINFIEFGYRYCDRLESLGKKSSAQNHRRTVNALFDFVSGRQLPITEITSKFLSSFESFLKSERTIKRKNQFGNTVVLHKKGLSQVSVIDYMTDIRTLFNAAKSEFNDTDKGEIRIKHYPFSKYKIKRPPASRNRVLSIEQINAIRTVSEESLALPGAIFARDIFLLSFYLVGTNLIDLYNTSVSGYANGRFSYERAKTAERRQDSAFISIRVEPEANYLFEKYKDKTGKRIFDFYTRYNNPHNFSSNVNKGLKRVAEVCGIKEPLSTYYARHSWATIARNDCRVSKDDINLALNHVDERLRITDIYIKKDWSQIDKANREVLNRVFGADDLL